jgi:hypothetical protein
MFVTVTKYLSVPPGMFSRELGEIPTQTPGRIDPMAKTTQLALSFTVGLACEVAVTVIMWLTFSAVSLGMVTLSVAVPDAPGASGPIEVLERLDGQLGAVLSLFVKLYVSETVLVFFTVTVNVNVLPDRPLLEVGEIETSTWGAAPAMAIQLFSALTPVPVAVTRTLSLAPLATPLGIVTYSVAVFSAPAAS